ncbi:Phosphatidylethanolamine-binding F40A3.3 [Hypsizygus marmoreus]|uniref:Phosphatidylethanolamine-binding F40A3.3 n=1 Tax=Hypsizygus marmoreus TaxID=39966 RepID=A0A369K3C6_HYPMA|nr:Phosphatidylethanolamine-binding F40A3.3 [Hypsizygus marmoreus]
MTDDPLSSIVFALKQHHLIPDVVPKDFTPSVLFSIIWPTGAQALLGNFLTIEEAQDEPEVSFIPLTVPGGSEVANDVTYTLVMTDPDAPSRADPKYRQWRHWVITGLKIPSAATEDVAAVKTKPSTTPYQPPGPPPGSGVHRYAFLLFEEPAAGIVIPRGAVEHGAKHERRGWNAMGFGDRYGLKLVGADFFLVRAVG